MGALLKQRNNKGILMQGTWLSPLFIVWGFFFSLKLEVYLNVADCSQTQDHLLLTQVLFFIKNLTYKSIGCCRANPDIPVSLILFLCIFHYRHEIVCSNLKKIKKIKSWSKQRSILYCSGSQPQFWCTANRSCFWESHLHCR